MEDEKVKYDKSVDVFAVGLMFLSMIQAKQGKPLLQPKCGKVSSFLVLGPVSFSPSLFSFLSHVTPCLFPLVYLVAWCSQTGYRKIFRTKCEVCFRIKNVHRDKSTSPVFVSDCK